MLWFRLIWTPSCCSITSEMCTIELTSYEFGGQDINWNSVSWSWNYSNTIWAQWQRAFSCWNIPIPVGKTDAKMSAIGSRWCLSVAFKARFSSKNGSRDVQKVAPKNIMLPPPVCVSSALNWRNNRSLGKWRILIRSSTWWMTTHDSSHQVTPFRWILVQ